MIEFYQEGGWGMYPVTVFGFFYFATVVLSVMRPGSQSGARLFSLGGCTVGAGVLGTCMGIMSTARFVERAPAPEQLVSAMLGLGESTHVLALSMLLFVPATLVLALGTLRKVSVTAH